MLKASGLLNKLKKIRQTSERLLERFVLWFSLVAGVSALLMALLASYGVVRRYVLNSPESYSYELSIMFMVACVVLVFPGVQLLRRNIRIDFAVTHLPESVQAILLNIVGPVLALFYCVILTWKSWDAAWYSLQIGEVSLSLWAVPLFPVKFIVPIGYALLCLVLIVQLFYGITSLIQRILNTK